MPINYLTQFQTFSDPRVLNKVGVGFGNGAWTCKQQILKSVFWKFNFNTSTGFTTSPTTNITNYRVGQNLMVNRFISLNNKIDYLWFNLTLLN